MGRVTDEEFYEHHGEWYSLGDETDTLVALLALAVARFRHDRFAEPVNAVEIGWNLEGHFLRVSLLSHPEYPCYGQGPFEGGVSRRGNVVAYNSDFSVPSWAFLFAQTSPNLPAGPLLRVLDHERVEVASNAIHSAVGRNVFRVVLECRPAVFTGITFANPYWLIVYFCEDADESQVARVSGDEVVVFQPPREGLSKQWFTERSNTQ